MYKNIILLFTTLFFSYNLFSQTDQCNNNAGGELTVSGSCITSIMDTDSNNDYWNSASGCNASDHDDKWAWFTATNTSTTITYQPYTRDAILTLFTGACSTSMVDLDCADDGGDGISETVTLATTVGQIYRIRIQRFNSSNQMNGDICVFSIPPALTNDECAGALSVTVNADDLCGTTTAGTVLGATASPQDAAACNGTEDDDVWFSFVATETIHIVDILNAAGSTTDMYHSIWEGTCPGLTLVAGTCSDDDNQTVSGLTIGQTYFIRVYTWTGVAGQSSTFDVCIGTQGPPTPQDCSGATTVCSDAIISGNSSGSGNHTDLNGSNRGCLDVEHESSWYYFRADAGGTIELSITTAIDYDFAIWGPYTTSLPCPPPSSPFRCSFSGAAGNTGLAIGSGDDEDGTGGTLDAWVNEINASAGDQFIMLIDNFTADGTSFTLDWTLTSGATLDCSNLPVSFHDFTLLSFPDGNLLTWNTYSEINNSHFLIQKMDNNGYYNTIYRIEGQNNSSETTPYLFKDVRPEYKINIYRIVQVDFDGKENIFDPKSIDNSVNENEIVGKYNMLGQKINDNYQGIIILKYKDGSTLKTYINH